jgi:hypothetical protein
MRKSIHSHRLPASFSSFSHLHEMVGWFPSRRNRSADSPLTHSPNI